MKELTNLTITDLWEEYKRSFRDYWEGHDEVVKAFRKKLEGQYVIATIFTHRKRLVVKQDNKVIKSFSFPIKGHIVAPLLPLTKRKT